MDSVKAGGMVAVSDAVTLQVQQMLFDQLMALQERESVPTRELLAISAAAKNAVTGQRHVEKLRSEKALAIAEAEKTAKAGGTAADVVDKVREILGMGATA